MTLIDYINFFSLKIIIVNHIKMGKAPRIYPNLSNQRKIGENKKCFMKRKLTKIKENQQNQ